MYRNGKQTALKNSSNVRDLRCLMKRTTMFQRDGLCWDIMLNLKEEDQTWNIFAINSKMMIYNSRQVVK